MHDLRDEIYWHLTDRDGLLLNNVRVGKGWFPSVSHFAKGEMANAVTPYSLKNARSEKERFWEEIRATQFDKLPSRINALFGFLSKDDAERAVREWFRGEEKLVVEIRVAKQAKTHLADARHLDRHEPEWRNAAMDYWEGRVTEDPRPEVIIDGWVFFPGWEREPFG
ncbi:hypothetical protein D9M68_523400 [compost metagenome]